jgi:hypothetical protein
MDGSYPGFSIRRSIDRFAFFLITLKQGLVWLVVANNSTTNFGFHADNREFLTGPQVTIGPVPPAQSPGFFASSLFWKNYYVFLNFQGTGL